MRRRWATRTGHRLAEARRAALLGPGELPYGINATSGRAPHAAGRHLARTKEQAVVDLVQSFAGVRIEKAHGFREELFLVAQAIDDLGGIRGAFVAWLERNVETTGIHRGVHSARAFRLISAPMSGTLTPGNILLRGAP